MEESSFVSFLVKRLWSEFVGDDLPGFNKGFRLPAGDGISDDDVASFSTKIEFLNQ